MKTEHKITFSNARSMEWLPDGSVQLVVTSPPYPMIEMWDEIFARQSADVRKSLKTGDGMEAFERMHRVLDPVWKEVYRVLTPGGFACVNIGDATRTVKENFSLYPNHARILASLMQAGFSMLPCVLWRKQTNAPNKFMGSGMLPAGAYVTLEHEYILIARKGAKREFRKEEEKQNRRQSALFWEERNLWFSDVWFDIKGTRQKMAAGKNARQRSGAFPLELAFRLVNMYSVKGDTVLDPFWGTGTTSLAAMATGRNSIGCEIDASLASGLEGIKANIVKEAIGENDRRLKKHMEFVSDRLASGGAFKHVNRHYGFPVITAQEKELLFNDPVAVTEEAPGVLTVVYDPQPAAGDFHKDAVARETSSSQEEPPSGSDRKKGKENKQRQLF